MIPKLALQWLPCQAPGITVLGLVSLVSEYCDWVRWKVWSATSISVWQHIQLSEQIIPWYTLICCWDVKQTTNKHPPSPTTPSPPPPPPENKPVTLLTPQLHQDQRVLMTWTWSNTLTFSTYMKYVQRKHLQVVQHMVWHNYLSCTDSAEKKEQESVLQFKVSLFACEIVQQPSVSTHTAPF